MRKGVVFLVLLAFLAAPAVVSAVPYVSTASLNGYVSYANTTPTQPDFQDDVETIEARFNPDDYVSLNGRIDYTHYVNLPDVNEVYQWCLDLDVSNFMLNVNGNLLVDHWSYSNSWNLGTFAYAGSGLEYVHDGLASLVYHVPDFLDGAGITYEFIGDAESGALILSDISFDSWIVEALNELEVQTLYASLAGSVTLTAKAVPEPGTIVLMGLGLVGLAGMGRKKYLRK